MPRPNTRSPNANIGGNFTGDAAERPCADLAAGCDNPTSSSTILRLRPTAGAAAVATVEINGDEFADGFTRIRVLPAPACTRTHT